MPTDQIATLIFLALVMCLLIFRLEGTWEIFKAFMAWTMEQIERLLFWFARQIWPSP